MAETIALYPERPSANSEIFQEDIEILNRPPEFDLTDDQRMEIQAFEADLLKCKNSLAGEEEVVTEVKPYSEIKKILAGEKKVCLDYFLTQEGNELLNEILGTNSETETNEEIKSILSENRQDISVGDWKKLMTKSTKWGEERLVVQLHRKISGELVVEQEPEPEYMSFIRTPEKLVEKAKASRELKMYYKKVTKELQHQDSQNPVVQAKLQLVRMARERLNLMIAEEYRQAMIYQNQESGDIPPENVSGNFSLDLGIDVDKELSKREMLSKLQEYLPALQRSPSEKSKEIFREKAARFLSRIDKFINGVSVHKGEYTIISQELLDIQRQQQESQGSSIAHTHEGLFSDIDNELLSQTFIDANECKKMAEIVLTEYDLLSEEVEYDPDRKQWAADGKWQVIIDENATSLSVNGTKGILRIPKNYHRQLNSINPAGPLQVLDHEITHILQHQNALRVGLATFEQLAVPRTSLWSEAGGIYKEQIARKRLFGLEAETPAMHYLAALLERLKGGTILESAQAFYEDSIRRNPDVNREDAMKLAVNRTLRLFRNGGELTLNSNYWSNTAPLDYAEQTVLIDQLPEDKKSWLTIGRSNLGVLAQLHRLGWLQNKEFIQPEKSPSEILEPYVREVILAK